MDKLNEALKSQITSLGGMYVHLYLSIRKGLIDSGISATEAHTITVDIFRAHIEASVSKHKKSASSENEMLSAFLSKGGEA